MDLTEICSACERGDVELVQGLQDVGTGVNILNEDGVTPLYLASVAGQVDMVKLLIVFGANVNTPNKDGVAPLYRACAFGQVEMVQLLIESSTQVNIQNEDGVTPVSLAAAAGQFKVVQLLIELGADVNIQNKLGITPLWQASATGRLKIVKLLIESGAKLDTPDRQGAAPLHIASEAGHAEIVHLLLQSAASVNTQAEDGATSLYVACRNGHQSVVQLLLSSDADVNFVALDGQSPLWISCYNRYTGVVQLLLSAGANINKPRDDGMSPLFIVSYKGYLDVVRLLLSSGASANVSDHNGTSPLWVACRMGHSRVVQALVSSGADVNAVRTADKTTALFVACQGGHLEAVHLLLSKSADINRPHEDGTSPLVIASQKGHFGAVQMLLSSGTDVNSMRRTNGATALFAACQEGNLNIVQLLLSYGADVNLARTTDGVTALIIACQIGYLKVIQLLLSSGADVNRPCYDGASPLRIASSQGQFSIVQLILAAGADVNSVQTTTQMTALYKACEYGHLRVAQLLLLSGADPNMSTGDGVSPLLVACQEGYIQVVQLLISSGAAVNSARTTNGTTPLYMACQKGHFKIVQLLLSSGANVNRPRYDAAFPLYIATQKGHHHIVQLLLASGANVNQCTDDFVTSPLHAACLHSDLKMVLLLCNGGADILNAGRLCTAITPLYCACDSGQLAIVQFLLAQETPINCRSIIDNMSELHAYCLSLCRQDLHSDVNSYLFLQNFVALLADYKLMCEMSDHHTTVLDMLLLAHTSKCLLIDKLIENLAYFMAMEGMLSKPLCAILPEKNASRGKLKDSYGLHTTLSALVSVLDTELIGKLLKNIMAQYGQKQFLFMCKGLLHQNILHSIAQYKHNNNESVEKAKLFLDLGVDIWAKDINGRLPLHMACMMANTQLAKCYWVAMKQTKHFDRYPQMDSELIYCRLNYLNKKECTYNFPDFMKQCADIDMNIMMDNVGMLPSDYKVLPRGMEETIGKLPHGIQKLLHDFNDELTFSQLQSLKVCNISNDDMNQLLHFPSRGKVLISGENKLIFSSVVRLVEIICGCIGDVDPYFACKPVLSGSVYEGTKTSQLDELDICLKLLNFDAIAQVGLGEYQGIFLARCTPPALSSLKTATYWRQHLVGKWTFSNTLFCARFWQLFLESINFPVVSEYLSMARIVIHDCQRKSGFVGTMSITWYGEMYPCLPISVDLVPLVELADYYCLLRPRYFDNETVGMPGTVFLELSCNKKDKIFMTSLSAAQKDAYCLAKIVRGLAKSFISNSGRILTSDNVIQSYLLKTSLMWIVDPKDQFHQYYRGLRKSGILAEAETVMNCASSTSHIYKVRMLTVKIFTMLKRILQSGHKMHTYNLPLSEQQNVIHVRDRDLAIELCEKCIHISRPG